MNCLICGKPNKIYYNKMVAKTCGAKSCIRALTERTMREKHGDMKSIVEKREKTTLARYGVKNVSSLDSIKEQKTETCIKNFGVKHPMQSKIVREKSIATLEDTYGVTNISYVQEIKDKIIRSRFAHDPILGMSPFKYGQLKSKKECLEKYGVEHYFQTDKFKRQYKNIMLEKHGVDNYFKSDEFKKQMLEDGYHYSPEDIKRIEIYYKAVQKYTRINYKLFKNIIEFDYKRTHLKFELDHIFSISEGFKHNIEPKIIGSLINLQIIPHELNRKKGKACWLSLEELNQLYDTFLIENSFYNEL